MTHGILRIEKSRSVKKSCKGYTSSIKVHPARADIHMYGISRGAAICDTDSPMRVTSPAARRRTSQQSRRAVAPSATLLLRPASRLPTPHHHLLRASACQILPSGALGELVYPSATIIVAILPPSQ
eukprot:6183825-Pleurochrysis_carterae.AAC.1